MTPFSSPLLICLMGPTAAGKTALAVELVQNFPFEIISVDSAMVYKGMDIGTAKPSVDILAQAPHRLINMRDPSESYSAGQFVKDALEAIADIHAAGKIPLLVGGTMLYFRALQQGLAPLPKADPAVRAALQAKADQVGWETLHQELLQIDPALGRIQPSDSQRIQRAWEVYHLTGHSIAALQKESTRPLSCYAIYNIALAPQERTRLHTQIAARFDEMLAKGFIAEVEHLYRRGDLNADLPSMRSVGYRQIWAYLAEETSYNVMREQAIIATRQLAKRQVTWLRSWSNRTWFNSDDAKVNEQVIQHVQEILEDPSLRSG